MKLCHAGWQITRGGVAKIEAQLVVVPDYELLYFTRLFEVPHTDLFPRLDQSRNLTVTLNKLLTIRNRRPNGHKNEPAGAMHNHSKL